MSRLFPLMAALLGMSFAFFISGVLAQFLSTGTLSRQILSFLYSLGLFPADMIFAGTLPDALTWTLGRLGFALSCLSLLAAALTHFINLKRLARSSKSA